jgi:hypothetical protein
VGRALTSVCTRGPLHVLTPSRQSRQGAACTSPCGCPNVKHVITWSPSHQPVLCPPPPAHTYRSPRYPHTLPCPSRPALCCGVMLCFVRLYVPDRLDVDVQSSVLSLSVLLSSLPLMLAVSSLVAWCHHLIREVIITAITQVGRGLCGGPCRPCASVDGSVLLSCGCE